MGSRSEYICPKCNFKIELCGGFSVGMKASCQTYACLECRYVFDHYTHHDFSSDVFNPIEQDHGPEGKGVPCPKCKGRSTDYWDTDCSCPKCGKRMKEIALKETDRSPRELAWHITDTRGYYISESSVYKILREYDLLTSPHYIVMSAADSFQHKTKRINEMWQTDFTYFKVVGWGWFYLSTILDDYSRYILSWKLFTTMNASDVQETLDMAIENTGVDQVKVKHKPRLLSDNGPCYISQELKDYLNDKQMDHTRGAPYHPQTQGKIERYHRSMKNVIKLENYYLPWELEKVISEWVEYYNNTRLHESLDNITPADMYYGRKEEILTQRQITKQKTLLGRKRINLKQRHLEVSIT